MKNEMKRERIYKRGEMKAALAVRWWCLGTQKNCTC